MTPDQTQEYALAVASVLKLRRLPRAHVRAILIQIGFSGEGADAVIAHGLATGLYAEATMFGEAYLFADSPKA